MGGARVWEVKPWCGSLAADGQAGRGWAGEGGAALDVQGEGRAKLEKTKDADAHLHGFGVVYVIVPEGAHGLR